MSRKTILVTGGLGFIGSNFIHYCLAKYPAYSIVNVDLLTDGADPGNLHGAEMNPRYTFHQADIRDAAAVKAIFQRYQITDVVHFAAETRKSHEVRHPKVFGETNIIGTFNLLEAAYKLWQEGPRREKMMFLNSRFHHISTAEIYGSSGEDGFITEKSPHVPNSPYSASKASADSLVRSFYHMYGMNVVTTNSSNIYGPLQPDNKLVPTIIRKALANEEIPVYGDGRNTRDWLFVLDYCAAIDKVFHQGRKGETYLVGGNNKKSTIEIAHLISNYLDQLVPRCYSYNCMIRFVDHPQPVDYSCAIDASKMAKELHFSPLEPFETGLLKTIDWYVGKYKRIDVLHNMG